MNNNKQLLLAVVVTAILTAVLTWCVASRVMISSPVVSIQPPRPSTLAPTTIEKGNVISVGGLQFTIPTDWTEAGYVLPTNPESKLQTLQVSVPDSQYNVRIPISVVKNDIALTAAVENEMVVDLGERGRVYDSVCAPALACYYLVRGNDVYSIAFEEPVSDQPVPKDAEVWFPDTTVTKAQILDVVKTVK